MITVEHLTKYYGDHLSIDDMKISPNGLRL